MKVITRTIRKGGKVRYNNRWYKPWEKFLPYDRSLDGKRRRFIIYTYEEDALIMDEDRLDIVEKRVNIPFGFTTIPAIIRLRKQWVVIEK